MRHKHHDMIVAKAKNMNLVAFYKDGGEWFPCAKSAYPYLPDFDCAEDYFLCLPKHNENGQCLHWLNGGEVLVHDSHNDQPESKRALKASSFSGWHFNTIFMSELSKISIKPKTEKRWIIWDIDKGEIHQVFNREASGFSDPKFNHSMHEIEVEVRYEE